MKIKTDFITNSSSSSFLVVFDKLPESVEEMKKLLFGEREEFSNPYNDEEYWKTSEIAEKVLEQTFETNEEALNDFFSSTFDYDFKEYIKDGAFDWELNNKNRKRHVRKEKRKFIKTHPNRKFVIYEFSDSDGAMYTAMEHGNLFRNVEHIKQSNH